MKTAKYILLAIVIIITGVVFFFLKNYSTPNNQQNANKSIGSEIINNSNNMKLSNPAFENNGNIPVKYTCDGEGINPPLAVNDIPENVKSLALIMDDPDAPVSGGFVHWVAFNLDPAIKEIAENSAPGGIEGVNSSGKTGYTPPCPPSGVHHYQFKLYALDKMLELDSSAKKEDVEKAMEGHILDQALLVGLYQR